MDEMDGFMGDAECTDPLVARCSCDPGERHAALVIV